MPYMDKRLWEILLQFFTQPQAKYGLVDQQYKSTEMLQCMFYRKELFSTQT